MADPQTTGYSPGLSLGGVDSSVDDSLGVSSPGLIADIATALAVPVPADALVPIPLKCGSPDGDAIDLAATAIVPIADGGSASADAPTASGDNDEVQMQDSVSQDGASETTTSSVKQAHDVQCLQAQLDLQAEREKSASLRLQLAQNSELSKHRLK